MASITINFANATSSSSNTSIILSRGSFALAAAEGLSISGAISFTSLYVTTGAISFEVAPGISLNGAVESRVSSSTAGSAPTIEVTNFQGTVAVMWPTDSGIQTQNLEPGEPLMLSGYVG